MPTFGYLASATASPIFSDRKSTRLNSSHLVISYAVFCLKKKKSFRQLLSGLSKRLQHVLGADYELLVSAILAGVLRTLLALRVELQSVVEHLRTSDILLL